MTSGVYVADGLGLALGELPPNGVTKGIGVLAPPGVMGPVEACAAGLFGDVPPGAPGPGCICALELIVAAATRRSAPAAMGSMRFMPALLPAGGTFLHARTPCFVEEEHCKALHDLVDR